MIYLFVVGKNVQVIDFFLQKITEINGYLFFIGTF